MLTAEIEAVTVKAGLLAEIPATALAAAAGFADHKHPSFDAVHVLPSSEDGQVLVTAACSARGVELRCQGTCQRAIALPVLALQAVLRRHRDAHHVVLVKTETGLSVRSFSTDATTICTIPESGGTPMMLPPAPAGEFTIDPLLFNSRLLSQTLRDLSPADTVQITPFSMGWRLEASCDEFSAIAVVAGMRA